MEYRKLEKSFYVRKDTLKIARELLGKYLLTDIGGKGITGGKIVETEAYLGAADKASHGYNNRRTKRNENLYKEGGGAYVYFCYGMYYLFNVVTGKENTADAVLIRAIEPEIGTDLMVQRKIGRLKSKNKNTGSNANASINRLTSGPGLLSIALGIDLKHNGISICESKNNDKLEIWLEDRHVDISEKDITETPRIGIAYAEEHALLPWRFKIKPAYTP
ncbi:MAG: DNA-3-methyladenine glycosylase [bacterium]